MKNKILDCIYDAIDKVNNINNIDIKKLEDTVLFGRGSKIDSLTLVQLVIAVEYKINEEFDTKITIADDKAFSLKNSPFKSIDKLKNYLYIKLDEIIEK